MLGIFLAEKVAIPAALMNGLLGISFLSLLYFSRRLNTYAKRWISGVAINAFLMLLGFQMSYYQNETHLSQHFQQEISEENHLIGVVQNVPTVKNKKIKIELKTQAIGTKANGKLTACEGKLLAYLYTRDSLSTIKYGDRILLSSRIQPLQKAKNPNAFEYSRYLYFKNIHFQSFVYSQNWTVLES